MSSVAVDKFGVVGKNIQKGYGFSPANNQPYPTTQISVPWLFPPFQSDYVPTLDNDTFAIIKIQSINMQVEHWIMIAKSRQILFFADFPGRRKYSFLKQQ